MSKPSLRLQLSKLLLYHILLWQLGQWPQFKFHCRADGAVLPPDEVYALNDFMNNTELRPEQIIEKTYCSDVVWSYGFVIECNCTNESECRITGIRMSYLGLTGTIHESVGNLTSLTYLILSNNTLHGGIPDTIGNLKNLQVLDLSRNQLNGSIPASLGSMVSLRWLYLQYNLLSGDIPPSFGSLANLTELNLQFNMLSGSIPEDFGNLSNLTIMDLSENQLSGALPDNLRKLKNLTTLYVSANYLNGEFPKGYRDLTSLKKFSIAGNYISGPLPVETIAKWTNITHLVLVGNNFEGNLTEKIFRLQKLQYLLITDLANNSFQLPPNISNSANFISLTLRNCSINGTIPKYIGENMTSLRYLDLSFNKLTGGLPQNMSSKMIYMSFSRNMLNGAIAPSILGDSQTRIDLSFNYFSAEGSPVQSNQQLNLFACCRNSSTTEPQMMDPFEMKNRYCPENEPKYHSLFINCGGEETIVDGHQYDQDNDTSLFYTSPKKSWAYSLSGDFGVPKSNTSNYIKSMTRGVHEAPLYEKARFSPISLEYYVFCLRKGNYIVTLYFKEIVDSKDEDYSSLRKRVFDVYIQDVWRLNYFKIREEEGTTEGPITKKISAVVVNDSGLLNIHLYWPGKGSYQYHPSFNGPLISAISVTPELNSDKNNGQLVALITLASIVAALPLSLAFAWRMGWLPSEQFPKIETSQEKIVDEHQGSEELPSQEENGDEQRNTKDQGRRKNTEKYQGQEEIGDEHQDNEELPSQEEIGDEHQDSEELPSQEEIGDEPRNTKGQEEIGDEQRNTKDQGRRKNTKTKRKKKEKICDEHPDIVKKLGMFGLSYGFPLGMSSEELPSQEEIGDEHQDSEELPSQEEIGDEQRNTKGQEEIGDEQRNTKDQGRRKNTETKMKKKEKIGDEHPDTVKKLGMLGLSYGFPLGMSSEELLSQEEIGDEHQDSEELRSQQEISDEQRNTKGQEEIGDEQINTKDQGRRTNTKTRRKKNEKIGDEHLDAVKELINATENFSDKKKLGHSETFFMAQLPSHTVAVKKLDSAHFKGKIDKLKEEIGIIESLQHNNILKLLHAYIGKDLQFLVYEYMENKSLEDILFGSSTSDTIKLDWNTRVKICLGIAQGLQYLHERVQIVHTNIKSANILLNEKLEAKISDFGFANLYSEEDKVMAIARETKKGYTAPEYLQMDDLDSKLDVFSFGVVVLEIVSGERNVRNQSKKETEVLLDRAYKANRNGNLKSLVDKNLSTYDEREALIILKLALECTTMGASVRPEMSGVVSVLLGEKSIDEVCSPAKPTGDINVVGSLEESVGITDMAESLSPLWGS
ncbi:unnamed protein product [Malus baccata var. baccata]